MGPRPGLRQAGDKLTMVLVDQLLPLREALQQAQTAYRLTIAPQQSHQVVLERGAFVLGELEATLEWHFDDGVEDEVDTQLQTLSNVHADTASADRLAQALHDYGTLAKPLSPQGLGAYADPHPNPGTPTPTSDCRALLGPRPDPGTPTPTSDRRPISPNAPGLPIATPEHDDVGLSFTPTEHSSRLGKMTMESSDDV